MKKLLFLIFFSWAAAAFAQDIPAESFSKFRGQADSLFQRGQYEEAISLYMKLAFSDDLISCNKLYHIYSKGLGVEADKSIAEKWKLLERECKIEKKIACREDQLNRFSQDRQNSTSPVLLESNLGVALNTSGELIEKGATLKNAAIATAFVGAGVGGTIAIVGASTMNDGLIIAGSVVAGAFGLISLITDIRGNIYLRDGGRVLKHVKFEGNGIKVRF